MLDVPAPPLSLANPPRNAAASEPFTPAGKLAAYIATYAPADAEYITGLLADAFGDDALLFACIARYESGLRVTAVGAAGERGLLQIHPCHRKGMKRAGLDFYSERDRLAYAAGMYAAQGLKPWTVRRRAMSEYKRISK